MIFSSKNYIVKYFKNSYYGKNIVQQKCFRLSFWNCKYVTVETIDLKAIIMLRHR